MTSQPPIRDLKPAKEPVTDERAAFPVRHWLAVLLLTILCDLTIYHGKGFAGLALLFALAPFLLALATFRPKRWVDGLAVSALLAMLAMRLVWQGSALQVWLGFGLLTAFAMTLSGLRPYVLETVLFFSQTLVAGYFDLVRQWQAMRAVRVSVSGFGWLAIALPLVALLAFGMLFILANPNLMTFFGESVQWLSTGVRNWFVNYAPRYTQVLFWLAVIWIVTGLLRPLMKVFPEEAERGERGSEASDFRYEPAALYPAYRNTLLTVISLFAVYLVFEFTTLWFREFPAGFHYSGYAHEGAFWLTVALGLATVVLSLVFRGPVLRDPRQTRLRTLAWIWSAENLLLALAVYNRLAIYVGFNGMTRMRVIGVLGITAVVIGFLLVLRKIAAEYDFAWLIRRQLWILFGAVFLFAMLPVDAVVMKYNVHRILNGDPAPSVQISVHPISPEGILQLSPLLDCADDVIREGVAALLAQHQERADSRAWERRRDGWTAFQGSERAMLERLEGENSRLAEYASPDVRGRALEAFHKYAYQWY